MHWLFPCMEIITVFKQQSVSVPRSGVCLSFLTNACLPLKGLLGFIWFSCVHLPFIYAIGTCSLFFAATTTAKPVWYSYAQLGPSGNLNSAHSSCLFSRLLLETNKWASDALMMQTLQVLARDSLGLLVCLTDTAGDDTEMVNETLF